jgi:DNA polymerase-3 subunit epsilon
VRRRSPPWPAPVYWALDLETGGLDPARNPVLSVGMVPVRDGVVKVGESFYSLVHGDGPMDEASLAIHHILPDELAGAPPAEEVVAEIDRRLREGVLLVHFAAMDVTFLRRLYRRCGRRWRKPVVVDTAALAGRLAQPLLGGGSEEVPADLASVRDRFGLPRYTEHHALSDALATAELLLVLRHHIGARTLRDLT